MTFKSIPGYPRYEINEEGVVRNINRQFVLKQQRIARYHSVTLFNDTGNHTCYIHHLVALTFISERPNGMWIRHLDGNPSNNSLSNLRYGSQLDNASDRALHGTWGQSLTERHVRVMRGLYKCGFTQVRLRKLFKLHSSTVSRIITGKTWKYCNT